MRLWISVIFILPVCLSCSRKFGENVKIHEGNALGGPCEPSIYINPTNPENIVAGSILNNVHFSNDGGRSWSTDRLRSTHGVYGDPCVVIDADGHAYYFHLGDPEQRGWSSERLLESIVVQRSDDGGKTWNDGAAIGANDPKDQDKEWAVCDPNSNSIYVTWTEFDAYGSKADDCYSRILFSKSEDRAETWSAPTAINEFAGNCRDDDYTVEGAVPAVDRNGNIYVAWAYAEKIYVDRSRDGGQTWLDEDIEVADQPGGWVFNIDGVYRCNGMPVTIADLSEGEYANRIYVCWGTKASDSTDADVWLSWSDDEGTRWSDPVMVHSDQRKRDQFLPWMSVDPISGNIYIVYYDREKTDGRETHVSLSYSSDGGASFKQRTLTKTPFITPGQLIFFGDYNNISAYNGRVRPIWTEYADGKLSIWTSIIEKL